jgi:DNA polymerase-1
MRWPSYTPGLDLLKTGASEQTGKVLVFDLEANGHLDPADKIWTVCIKEVYPEVKETESYPPDQIDAALERLSEATHVMGHNILAYDIPLIKKLYPEWKEPKYAIDTLIMSRLFLSDRPVPYGVPGNLAPHSLAAWGYRVGRGKPDHDDWSAYSEAMRHRCTEDVEITWLTYQALVREGELTRVDWTDALRTEHAIAKHISTQEQNGVPFDLALATRTRLMVAREIRAIDKEVVPQIPEVPLPKSKQPTWPSKQFKKDGTPTQAALKYYGDGFAEENRFREDRILRTAPINLGSDKQVKEYLLSIGWEPTEWNFKKGDDGKPIRDGMGNKVRTSPKLTLDSLESCKFPGGQHVGDKIVRRLMLQHRLGMLTGWIRDMRPDGKLSARAIPMGTPTGRMTHREVVNVPGNHAPLGEELRSCFTAPPDMDRVGIDLSSCQLRALCHYMEDKEYQRQVIEGDPHQYAAELAGLDDRQLGKKLNYTTLFGGGIDKIATDLNLTKVKARKAQHSFFDGLPALPNLQNKLKREWKEKGYIVGLDGRAVWVRAEHMLLVYLLQTMESVVMKNFINTLMDRIEPEPGLVSLVTTMHDEVQFIVAPLYTSLFEWEARKSIEIVNEKFNLTCPQEIDVHVGKTWSECH